MKVWLDDNRTSPDGWVRVYTPEETIALLETGKVEVLSLDHDLGLPDGPDGERTGYTVAAWVEKAVALNAFEPPIIRIHSANSVGRGRMEAAIASIKRMRGE